MMEMNEKMQRIIEYQAEKYSGNGLEKDDLIQEGHIIFMIANEKYCESHKVKFNVYFTRLLQNRFCDLGRRKTLEFKYFSPYIVINYNQQLISSQMDAYDEDFNDTLENHLKSKDFDPEQQMIYDSLVDEISASLEGLELELFYQRLNPSIELMNHTKTGNITKTVYARYFKVKVAEIQKAIENIQQQTAEILSTYDYDLSAYQLGTF